jgi:regulatory protein
MHPLFICAGMGMVAIVKTKQADDCIAVELDNGELLKIPFQVMGLYRLEAGRAIDATEYAQLKEESQRYRCKKTALNYLAICPRSATEMERYLRKKEFDLILVREIVDGFRNSGYLDDADYAARYISNKLSKKLVGKNLLFNELMKKGIPRNVIRQALKESESIHGNFDEVLVIAEKKYGILKNKKNGISKLAYFLHSRGFDAELVNAVINRIRRTDKESFDNDSS